MFRIVNVKNLATWQLGFCQGAQPDNTYKLTCNAPTFRIYNSEFMIYRLVVQISVEINSSNFNLSFIRYIHESY